MKTEFSPYTIIPQALKPGDVLAVISPAAPSQAEDFEAGLAYLESIGLKPQLMPSARASRYYLAGQDKDRLNDLHTAFSDPNIKGILSARGGYGSMRLLPNLNWELIKANPKIIIGFSDLTSLLIPIYQETGLITFHGPMLTSNLIEGDIYTQTCLWEQVMGKLTYPYRIPNASAYTCLKPGEATGTLIGGNLSLLAALCGTPWQPKTAGCVLFIEDWHEQFYSLDRQFQQLRLAGLFDGITGLLLGDFIDIEQTWDDYSLKDLLTALTLDLPVPVGFGFSLGHGRQTATLPLGSSVRFEATHGHFEILSSPVALE